VESLIEKGSGYSSSCLEDRLPGADGQGRPATRGTASEKALDYLPIGTIFERSMKVASVAWASGGVGVHVAGTG